MKPFRCAFSAAPLVGVEIEKIWTLVFCWFAFLHVNLQCYVEFYKSYVREIFQIWHGFLTLCSCNLVENLAFNPFFLICCSSSTLYSSCYLLVVPLLLDAFSDQSKEALILWCFSVFFMQLIHVCPSSGEILINLIGRGWNISSLIIVAC